MSCDALSVYRFAANCQGDHEEKGSTHSLLKNYTELLRGRETLQTGERLHGFLRSVIYGMERWFECLRVSGLLVLFARTAVQLCFHFQSLG